MKRHRYTVGVLLLVLSVTDVAPAHASDGSNIKTVIEKWVMAFNKGDTKSFLQSCAPHRAVIDGFPRMRGTRAPHGYTTMKLTTR